MMWKARLLLLLGILVSAFVYTASAHPVQLRDQVFAIAVAASRGAAQAAKPAVKATGKSENPSHQTNHKKRPEETIEPHRPDPTDLLDSGWKDASRGDSHRRGRGRTDFGHGRKYRDLKF